MENGIEMSTTATIAKLAGIDAVRKAAASLGVRTVVPGLVKFCGVCFPQTKHPQECAPRRTLLRSKGLPKFSLRLRVRFAMNTQPNRVAPKLVGFRGGLGVGKSTAAAFLVENYGFTRIAFADALKIECYDFMTGETPPPASIPETITNAAFGLARKDDLAPHDGRLSDLGKIAYVSSNKDILRPLIQWWGTDYRREQNVNYWTGRLASRHRAVMRQGGRTVIDDVRFENEMQRVVDLGGVLVFLSTPDEARATRLRERDGIVNVGIVGHASEALANDIDDPRNRLIVENDGSVERLHDNLRAVVSVLGFESITASERGAA